MFRAELSDLRPGTDYEFRVGKLSPAYRFRTMPAKATNAVSFISGGDCGVNPHAVANNIQAARQDPMFAVVGGDLGYDNGRSVEISRLRKTVTRPFEFLSHKDMRNGWFQLFVT